MSHLLIMPTLCKGSISTVKKNLYVTYMRTHTILIPRSKQPYTRCHQLNVHLCLTRSLLNKLCHDDINPSELVEFILI